MARQYEVHHQQSVNMNADGLGAGSGCSRKRLDAVLGINREGDGHREKLAPRMYTRCSCPDPNAMVQDRGLCLKLKSLQHSKARRDIYNSQPANVLFMPSGANAHNACRNLVATLVDFGIFAFSSQHPTAYDDMKCL